MERRLETRGSASACLRRASLLDDAPSIVAAGGRCLDRKRFEGDAACVVDRRVPGPQRAERLWTCPQGDYKARSVDRPKCPNHPDIELNVKGQARP